jgi:hypothetical protein
MAAGNVVARARSSSFSSDVFCALREGELQRGIIAV